MKKNRKVESSDNSSADLVFEIGTEELPAAYAPGLIDQLKQEAAVLLAAHHLPYQAIDAYGTPRRLVLLVRGLAATQRKPGEEIRGPSKQAAYSQDGKPTPALHGFLRSQGGTLRQIKVVSSPKGDYLYLVKPPTVAPTAKVLPSLLTQLISRLRAPKTMRWDASGARFARPIRWLLALYGSTPIRCTFGSLTSAPGTTLGRPQLLRHVKVPSVEAYLQMLQRAGVLLNSQARRDHIERTVAKLAATGGGATAPEMIGYGLLDEVTHLVEQPIPLAADFDPKYLELPREVLLASMAKHQRVFAIESGGKLLPRCIAILEGKPGKPAAVRQVIERILNARLADSLLFWAQDRKRKLEQMSHELSGVSFHERLGSMADKTVRLRALSEVLAEAWQLTDEERSHVRRACQLAKADLVSSMVKEFPTLQGVIGKYYAAHSGEPPAVAHAIEEHYLPSGGRLPRTVVGGALAVIDKLDTLASYFSIGIEPTGDQDPFGLRRAAQGIVEVAWHIHRPLPLERLLFSHQAGARRDNAHGELGAAATKVKKYLFERLYTFAWADPAPPVDCIDAVLGSPCDDLVDAMDRIRSLNQLSGDPRLLKAAKVIERTRNILRSAALRQEQVDPARLQEPLERRLWDLYHANEQQITTLARNRSYAKATTLFGEVFFEPLHEFFDRVLVNVPDEALQQNRLALMRTINRLYTDRIADLSKLTVLQREESPA